MKKIVREVIIDESVADKWLAKNIPAIPDEFEDFEKKYDIEQLKKGIFYKKDNFIIIKNPQSLTNFGKSVRGVILPDGDFYLEIRSVAIHNDMLAVLKENGLIPKETTKNWGKILPNQSQFLTVQRVKDTNTIAIGESNKIIYNKYDYKKYVKIYNKFLEKTQEKCPNIKFINKLVGTKSGTEIQGDHIVINESKKK